MTIISTEDLLKSLKGPIAVVGNARPKRQYGRLIDSYPTVIRFNNYRIEGHEADVGTKTTLRCTSGWNDIEFRSATFEVSPFTASAPESRHLDKYLSNCSVPFFTPTHDIHADIPCITKPSTGIALLTLLSHLGLEADAFGFDGFKTAHYWTTNAQMDTSHSPREFDHLLQLPGITVFSDSYPYQELYDFCHGKHEHYDVNEGVALFKKFELRPHGRRIIEFGAGNGALSQYLENLGNEIMAVEVSEIAFARIPIKNKLLGNCLDLPLIEREFDFFVSTDVMEHLTINDIGIVTKQAARLAPHALFSVSTRPSGLLGPRGENLHITVRNIDWWRSNFERHFKWVRVHSTGAEDQFLVEASNTLPLTEPSRTTRRDDQLFLPSHYVSRDTAHYYIDSPAADGGTIWQPDVYPAAAKIGRSINAKYIVDVGCGQARKLVALADHFEIIGVDFKDNIRFCQDTYSVGTWVECDLEQDGELQINASILKNAVIICSDVIEHLVNPLSLLNKLKRLLAFAPVLILSTPDRVRTYGATHCGPPPNKSHVREWEIRELEALLKHEGFQLAALGHTRSNDRHSTNATSLFLLTNPGRPECHALFSAPTVFHEYVAPTAEQLTAPRPPSGPATPGSDAWHASDATLLAVAQRAIFMSHAGQPDEARRLIAHHQAHAGDGAPLRLALAHAALCAHDADRFNGAIQETLQLAPNDPACLRYLADLSLSGGDFATAADLYALAWKETKCDLAALGGLMVALSKSGQAGLIDAMLKEVAALSVSRKNVMPRLG